MDGWGGWAIAGAVGLVALWRARAQAARVALPPGDDDGTVVTLLRAGHKIEAIRRYRARHGCGLKDAKEAVEALAEGRTPTHEVAQPLAVGPDVEALIREGRMVEAIQAHREAHPDLGLAEAKAQVEALAGRLRG